MSANAEPAKRALVIGYGSIGARHAAVLRGLGVEVAVVSARATEAPGPIFRALGDAVGTFAPHYAVIANPTAAHRETLGDLAACGFRGRVLCEKPLTSDPATLAGTGFEGLWTGYNLRFLPAVAALRDALAGERVLHLAVECSSYLPDWRPGRDYRQTASATRAEGGGVLRDISHELDYAAMLAGRPLRTAASVRNSGTLGIEVEDHAGILAETEGGAMVSVMLSYVRRTPIRRIEIATPTRALGADLIAGTVTVMGKTTDHPAERDTSYRAMHAACLAGDPEGRAASAAEGLSVVRWIAAAEASAREGRWQDVEAGP
jgi:predicted dehydrogenase